MKYNEDFYWNVIESCDWRNVSKLGCIESTIVLKNYLSKTYQLRIIEDTKDFIIQKYKVLINKYNNSDVNKHLTLSDDSIWDLCSHVVGLGRDEYEKVYNDINMISRHKNHFTENFVYGFSEAIENLSNNK